MQQHGFVPGRLRQALQRAKKTATALAEHVKVSDNTVSRWLRGEVTPRPDVLREAAAFLEEPVSFFLTPLPSNVDEGSPSFMRSYAAATKRARLSAEAFKDRAREATGYIERHIELPHARFPQFRFGDDPSAVSTLDLERLALETRRFWGLGDGPIANVVRLLEHNGAVVVRADLGDKTLNAFSQWGMPEDRPYIILSSGKQSAVGSRFDAAHEIAHMVLHRHLPREVATRPEVHKLVELQANRFAGAFLMPAESFSRSVFLTTLAALKELKEVWGAPIGSMIMRLTELDLVNERQARRLWESYSPMRLKETHDNDGTPLEMPTAMRQAFEIMHQECRVSPAQVAKDIPFAIADVAAIGGLPLGYFRDEPLRMRARPDAKSSVLEFRRPTRGGS
jgi:Zn-dependent peptidase ImmA (M78 family)/transcriptional regulator with XRE-family HTH domain